ncbi:hypothetical protein QTA58_01770 [Neorhizobium sp. CSC1952]|uniref:hypothetical protein n=1 Tax=Neorhizobium sp. CSC1952 TaxID=2978974 RepID=UPI0025A56B28|nr:hypothetical protein [Rhizobium sp. CSC1952]WJR67520.1 hypothetical protein QTA58_01770 [Rhizobium sp. CSC1952]
MRNAAETTISQMLTRLSLAVLLSAATSLTAASHAFALSELRPSVEAPRQAETGREGQVQEAFEGTTLPLPGPAIDQSAQAGEKPAGDAQGDEKPTASPDPNAAQAQPDASDPPTEIIVDMSKLPEPVRRMREQIVEAAASGDIERLRPLLGSGADQTAVMNGESDDPIETLKSFSGDPDGQEILAIMLDILSTGAARFDAGTPDETYVWPYFTGKALDALTPPERVDLLRIVTAGDLAGMEDNGNYNFFRAGISPDGKWKFFSGGD